MSEISMIDVKAQVMTYDEGAKKWVPSGSGEPSLSKVQLFKHQQNNTHRIVARKIVDKEVVINCALVKGMRYNRATGTFHQWRDVRQVYGLNFANGDDATQFGDAVQDALDGSSNPRTSQSNSSLNGESVQELERERQRLLEEQREQERLKKMREVEEEADRRRVREEKLRKEKEEQQRLERESREKEELHKRLEVQRRKELEDEQQRLEEQERLMERRVAEKQRELDEMRALENRVQEDMQQKASSSPRHTPKRADPPEPEGQTSASPFGVSLRSPAVKNDFPHPPPPPPQQIEEPAPNDIEAVAVPRPPSPVYNIPAPPPDIPSTPNINKARIAPQTSVTQATQISKTKSIPTQKSQTQDNLMDEIQRKLAARKKISDKSSEDPQPQDQEPIKATPAPPANVFNNKFNSLPRTNQSSFVKKQAETNKTPSNPSASVSPFRQSFVSDKKDKSDITSEELQTLKTEIMKDIKVELERTKQEILAEIRKELGKR